MATSGSYDYSVTAANIITEAMELLGQIAIGLTVSTANSTSAIRTLNLMIKNMQSTGMGLWLNKDVVLFLQADDVDYSLGPSGDNCALVSDAAKTELAANAAAAATAMTVDAITGIANGDYVGVETSNGDIHWTTVNGAPSGTTVTLTAGLDYASVTDAHLYAYTTKIQRPLEIIEARLRDSDDRDTPLYICSRQEYMDISEKTSEGRPNQIYYDPQLTNGVLYVWPEPDDMKQRIYMTVKYPIEDFDATTNSPDFPQEWILPMSWGLAVFMAPKFGVEPSPFFVSTATNLWTSTFGFDKEMVSLYFGVKTK